MYTYLYCTHSHNIPINRSSILHNNRKHWSCLTVLYSFHVFWKSRLPSSLRWMTVHPPPAVSMLQYTYTGESGDHQIELSGRSVGKPALGC